MKFSFDLRKSVNENAALFFEKAKKLRKKIEGIDKTIETYKKKELQEIKIKEKESKKTRKTEWFEKFRWFYTSEGTLCIGGRDASTNEILIKKYTDQKNIVFHTEMSGSPFFILKTEKQPSEKELQEVATATACYSKAWKRGIAGTDVFYVSPEQVSKEAESGEYISKGSFMIRGKKNFIKGDMKLTIGIDKEGRVMAGPLSAIKTHCEKTVSLIQGESKTSDIAKRIVKKLGGDIDEFVKVIPPGGAKFG